jgi:hypothetical protein
MALLERGDHRHPAGAGAEWRIEHSAAVTGVLAGISVFALIEHYASKASLDRERIFAAAMRSSRVFSR